MTNPKLYKKQFRLSVGGARWSVIWWLLGCAVWSLQLTIHSSITLTKKKLCWFCHSPAYRRIPLLLLCNAIAITAALMSRNGSALNDFDLSAVLTLIWMGWWKRETFFSYFASFHQLGDRLCLAISLILWLPASYSCYSVQKTFSSNSARRRQ